MGRAAASLPCSMLAQSGKFGVSETELAQAASQAGSCMSSVKMLGKAGKGSERLKQCGRQAARIKRGDAKACALLQEALDANNGGHLEARSSRLDRRRGAEGQRRRNGCICMETCSRKALEALQSRHDAGGRTGAETGRGRPDQNLTSLRARSRSNMERGGPQPVIARWKIAQIKPGAPIRCISARRGEVWSNGLAVTMPSLNALPQRRAFTCHHLTPPPSP